MAVEQLDAKLVLEGFDLLADGGRRDKKLFRCALETQVPGGTLEHAHGAKWQVLDHPELKLALLTWWLTITRL